MSSEAGDRLRVGDVCATNSFSNAVLYPLNPDEYCKTLRVTMLVMILELEGATNKTWAKVLYDSRVWRIPTYRLKAIE